MPRSTWASQSLELSRELGDPFRIGWAAHFVGLGSLVTGRPEAAAEMLGESLDIWSRAGDKSGMVLLIAAIARLAGARGRVERQWRLLGAVDRLRLETGTDLVNQNMEVLGWRPVAGPETGQERAWFESGGVLSLDDALALAREEVAEDG